jgi:pimeloyl-ACP methyl ester carboxylesterase
MITRSTLLTLLLVTYAHAQVPATEENGDHPDIYARDTYRIDTLVCPFKNRIEYDPGTIECGLLQVPENREDPDSRFIELVYVRLNSTWKDEDKDKTDDEDDAGIAPGKRDDPIIYLTGGPGAVAEYYVKRFKDHRIRKHRDMYILEQRGIGHSADFCLNYSSRNPQNFNADSLEKSAQGAQAASEQCLRNAMAAGVDLSAYNTIENARDVKALRIALGFEQWNVWGISYGTILGQAYVKEDPEGIRAIALDSNVPLDIRANPDFWRAPHWYDRDLKKLDELCQADDSCAGSFPDLGKRVRDAARATMGKPIAVEVKDTEQYPSGKAYFLSDAAAFMPFSLFYEQENYPALPAIIYAWANAIENRDDVLFKAAAVASGDFVGISQGMYDAVLCNDGFRQEAIASTAADRAEHPVLTDAVYPVGAVEAREQSCVNLGLTPRPRDEYTPVQTDIPTLLIEGDMDPITPPPLAHAIEPGFSHVTFVEFPYAGHGPSRSVKCSGDLLNKFYDDPTAKPDLSCVDEMKKPEFLGSLYRTAAVPRFIVLAKESKKKLPRVAAWGGLSALPVVAGFLVLTFAPLVRRLEKRAPVPAQGARLASWGAAFFGTTALAVFGAAAGMSYKLSEPLLLFGMVPWAAFGAWAGVLAGLLGIAAIILAVRVRLKATLPGGALTGFIITGLAALSLSVFLVYWGLGP